MIKIYLRLLEEKKPFKTLSRKEISVEKILLIVNIYKMGFFKIKQKGKYVAPSEIQSNLNTHIIEVGKRRRNNG